MTGLKQTALTSLPGPIWSKGAPHTPRGRSLTPLAVAALGLLLLTVGHGLSAVIAVVALAAGLIPAETVLRRIMLCIPALVGATSCLLTVTAVLHVPVDAQVLVASSLIVLAGLRMLNVAPRSTEWAARSDLWSLAAPVFTFVVLYRPFFSGSTGERLALMSKTSDASTHFGLIRTSLREGGYLTLLPDVTSAYPPGLSGNLGLLLQVSISRDPNLAELVEATVPLLVCLYALVAWIGTWMAVATVEAIVEQPSRQTYALTAGTAMAASVLGLNLLLWTGNAYAQILATAAILAAYATVLKPQSDGVAVSIVLALFTVASTHAWYLIAPVLAIPWLYHLSHLSGLRRLTGVGAMLLAGSLSTFPVFNGPNASTQLSAPGAVAFPSAIGLSALLLIWLWAVWCVAMRCRSIRSVHLLPLTLLISLLAMAIALGAFQLVVSGTVAYYSAKILYSAFVAGSILAAAGVGVLWHRRQMSTQRRLLTALAIIVSLSTAGSGLLDSRSDAVRYIIGNNPSQSKLLHAAATAHPLGLPADVDVWFADDCRRGMDRINSKWFQELALARSPGRENMLRAYAIRRPGDVTPFIQRAAEPQMRRVEVYVRNPCYSSELASLAGLSGVTVRHVP